MRQLFHELQQIQSREQLLAAKPKLTKLFLRLTDTILSAESFHKSHPEAIVEEPSPISEPLQMELCRIYRLDGGREIVEAAQEPALRLLTKRIRA